MAKKRTTNMRALADEMAQTLRSRHGRTHGQSPMTVTTSGTPLQELLDSLGGGPQVSDINGQDSSGSGSSRNRGRRVPLGGGGRGVSLGGRMQTRTGGGVDPALLDEIRRIQESGSNRDRDRFNELINGTGSGGGNDVLEALTEEFQRAHDEANQANESRYQDILDDFGNRRTDTTDRLLALQEALAGDRGAAGESLREQLEEVMKATGKDFDGRLEKGLGIARGNRDSLDKDLAGRTDRAMRMLNDMGRQQSRDIREDFQGVQSQQDNDMVRRGLSGSTVGATLRQGVGRERNASLARLGESLRREKTGAYERLSGDRFAARERGNASELNTFANLSGDAIGAMNSLRQQGLGQAERLSFQGLGSNERILTDLNNQLGNLDAERSRFMENRNDVGPDFGQLAQLANQIGQGTLVGGGTGFMAQDPPVQSSGRGRDVISGQGLQRQTGGRMALPRQGNGGTNRIRSGGLSLRNARRTNSGQSIPLGTRSRGIPQERTAPTNPYRTGGFRGPDVPRPGNGRPVPPRFDIVSRGQSRGRSPQRTPYILRNAQTFA